MKKVFFTIMVIFLAAVVIYGFPAKTDAVATGPCSGCHTMHSSQGGVATTPNNYLLSSSCIACHTGAGAATTAYVDKTTATQLAGGTFLESAGNANTPAKRHDVVGYVSTPGLIAAPGTTGSPQTVGIAELTCAGTKGCHGTHNVVGDAGIAGYHHGSKVGYRFLYIGVSTYDVANKVLGTGLANFESGGATSAAHNVYSASTTVGISKLCANCHGQFHGTSNTNAASPFKRHPTDNTLLSTGWTLTSVVTDYDKNPFAFADYTTVTTGQAYTASTSGASVACISCHRAHGSANDDLLRYAYPGSISAGNATNEGGCENCHYKQR